MIDLKKFIQAVDLVKTRGCYSLGLIIKPKTGKINWDDFLTYPYQIIDIEQSEEKQKTFLNKMLKAVKEKNWLVLELKDNLPGLVYSQLKLLSLNNRMQVLQDNEISVERLADRSRVIVVAYKENIKDIEQRYPDFRNLFGPIINIK